MKSKVNFSLDLDKKASVYYELLSAEDFDFKTKSIDVSFNLNGNLVEVVVVATSFIDTKIGVSSIMKSLEIIEKTLNV